MLGSIPIVDATYASDDGESAKECDDPARFWRDGSPEFPHHAPFVFVDDWKNMPAAISKYLAHTSLDQRFAQLADYRTALEDYLRAIPLSTERSLNDVVLSAQSTCAETPFTDAQTAQVLDVAGDYYTTNWFYGHVDSPGSPGIGCTQYPEIYAKWPEVGAYCFDARCAPPLVFDFRCSFD